MKFSINESCPCGSNKKYKKCCKIFHNGANAKLAIELMKSRYSAFVTNNAEYIINTTHKDNIEYTKDTKNWRISILDFSKNTLFESLEIVSNEELDNIAYVTFKVNLIQENERVVFTEKSKFYKINNIWLYHSGEFL